MQYHAITQSIPSLFSRLNWDQMPAQASASGRMRKTKKIQPPEAFFFFLLLYPHPPQWRRLVWPVCLAWLLLAVCAGCVLSVIAARSVDGRVNGPGVSPKGERSSEPSGHVPGHILWGGHLWTMSPVDPSSLSTPQCFNSCIRDHLRRSGTHCFHQLGEVGVIISPIEYYHCNLVTCLWLLLFRDAYSLFDLCLAFWRCHCMPCL